MNNEINKLKKCGYTEEEINLSLDGYSNFNASSQPLREGRKDIGLTYNGKKVSSIMLGYNKGGIVFKNGDYVGIKDFVNALNKELSKDDKDVIYACKRTGKRIDRANIANEMLGFIKDNSSSLIITSNNRNKNAKNMAIRNHINGNVISKGMLLGASKMQLENGEYINKTDIYEALKNYVRMTKSEVNVTPVPEPMPEPVPEPVPEPMPNNKEKTEDKKKQEELDAAIKYYDELLKNKELNEKSREYYKSEKEEKHRVVKKKKHKFKWLPAVALATVIFISGFGLKNNNVMATSIKDIPNANFAVTEMQDVDMEKFYEKVEEDLDEKKLGDIIKTNGETYYVSSDRVGNNDARHGNFGSEIRQDGEYTIEHIAIVKDGQVIKVAYDKGVSLGDFVNKSCIENNCTKDDVNIAIHVGGPVSGWVAYDDLLNSYIKNDYSNIRMELSEKEHISGQETNFNGIINLDNGITAKVVDNNGKLLPSGSVVIGSDGNQYRIDKLNEFNTTREEQYVESVDTKLNWSIHNISKEEMLIAGLSALAAGLLVTNKKENEEDKGRGR